MRSGGDYMVASIYRSVAENFRPLGDLYRMIMDEVLTRARSGRILDVGTGSGHLPMEMTKIEKGLDITGIDVSRGMIRNAARKSRKSDTSSNVKFLVADVKSLPFDDCVFDLVISSISFHSWKEPIKSLMEMYRVTKEGGECWVYDAVADIKKDEKSEFLREYGLISYCLVRTHIQLKYQDILGIISSPGLPRSNISLERRGLLFRIRMVKVPDRITDSP